MGSRPVAVRWLGLFADSLTHLRSIVLSTLLLGLTGSILWTLWRETERPLVLISQVQVPEALAKRGYTADVVMNQMAAELRHIDHKSQAHVSRPDLQMASAQVDVQVPGTGLSFRWLVRYLKDIWNLGRQDTTIGGAIIEHGDAMELKLTVTGPLGAGTMVLVKGPRNEIDTLIRVGAEDATSVFSPYVLGSYYARMEEDRCERSPPCNFDRVIPLYEKAIGTDTRLLERICGDLRRLNIAAAVRCKRTGPR